MKKILGILKSIGIIIGTGTVVVSLTIAFNNSKHRQNNILVKTENNSMILQDVQSDLKKVVINDSLQDIKWDALRNSYVNKSYDELSKKLLTTEEFISYMHGIGFEDIKKKQRQDSIRAIMDTMEYKITVKKIKK